MDRPFYSLLDRRPTYVIFSLRKIVDTCRCGERWSCHGAGRRHRGNRNFSWSSSQVRRPGYCVQTANGEVLRLTHFKTSNGPDLHVILIAATDGEDNENFLDKKIERVELGALKGNEGDQNYMIPAGTDLEKFKAVSIYCVRFNANFGTAPLQK